MKTILSFLLLSGSLAFGQAFTFSDPAFLAGLSGGTAPNLSVAQYKLNGDVVDSGPYNYAATAGGSILYTNGQDTVADHAVFFNSDNISLDANLMLFDNTTISFWFKGPMMDASWVYGEDFTTFPIPMRYIYVHTDGALVLDFLSSGTNYNTGHVICDTNNWHFVAFVFTATNVSYYADGGSLTNLGPVVPRNTSAATPTLAYPYADPERGQFTLDDVRLTNSVLTEVQLDAIYAAGAE